MDALLLGITAVSLAIAFVTSLVAWRMARDGRARAAARVAALSITTTGSPDSPVHGLRPARHAEPAQAPWGPAPTVTQMTRVSPFAAIAAARADRPSADHDVLADDTAQDLRLRSSAEAPPRAGHADTMSASFLGGNVRADGRTRRRGMAMAAAVLMVALVGLGASVVTRGGATPAAVIGSSDGSPLELLSLRHERSGDQLSVAGLVRNPAAGAAVERLTTVVYLFDREGAFVTSAAAPVDVLRLDPGDESPFVLTVTAPASVARYRVSFRIGSEVVPHMDRRGAPSAEPGVVPIG